MKKEDFLDIFQTKIIMEEKNQESDEYDQQGLYLLTQGQHCDKSNNIRRYYKLSPRGEKLFQRGNSLSYGCI